MKNEMEYLLTVRVLQGADLKGKTMQIESNCQLDVGTTHTFGDYTFLVLSSANNPLPENDA
jgi:hypothetical protein